MSSDRKNKSENVGNNLDNKNYMPKKIMTMTMSYKMLAKTKIIDNDDSQDKHTSNDNVT
jgi:hypothetical protein